MSTVYVSALSVDIRAHMCLTGCFKAKGIVLKGLLNTTIQSKKVEKGAAAAAAAAAAA